MIKKGYSIEEIIVVMPGYPQHDAEELWKELKEEML